MKSESYHLECVQEDIRIDGIQDVKPNRFYINGRDVTDYKTWKEFEQIVTDQVEQIRSLEEQLKDSITPKFKPKDIVYVKDGEEMVDCFIDKVIVLYDGSFLYEAYNSKGTAFSKLYKSNGFNIYTESEGKRLAELKGETNG